MASFARWACPCGWPNAVERRFCRRCHKNMPEIAEILPADHQACVDEQAAEAAAGSSTTGDAPRPEGPAAIPSMPVAETDPVRFANIGAAPSEAYATWTAATYADGGGILIDLCDDLDDITVRLSVDDAFALHVCLGALLDIDAGRRWITAAPSAPSTTSAGAAP